MDSAADGGIERMKKILESHGIEMSVGGCGCCGSPWVTFMYKGEVIIDDDNCYDVSFKTSNSI